MTLSDQWKKAENYVYLEQLKGRDFMAGWAWEFIRRGKAYQAAYASLEHLRHQYGSKWLTKQPRDLYDPGKLAGESDSAYMFRMAGLGLEGKPISVSQQLARTWMLRDMYDPDMPYDKNMIQFVARNPFPAFYADQRVKHIHAIQPFEDLQHDYVDTDTSHLLFVAFDATRPINEQIKKLRPVFAKYSKAFEAKTNDYKGNEDRWLHYIRFLDAYKADPSLSYISIWNALDPQTRNDAYQGASGYLEQAQGMADEGYKGLLFKLENH